MKHSTVEEVGLDKRGENKSLALSLYLHRHFMDTYRGIHTYNYNTFKAEDDVMINGSSHQSRKQMKLF